MFCDSDSDYFRNDCLFYLSNSYDIMWRKGSGESILEGYTMKCLLLASGFGTRLFPLNSRKPKALIQFKGAPLINHILNKIPQDISVMINSNKKFEPDFCAWQETLERKITLCVEPVYDEKQAFGAIGSILYWIKAKNITEDLMVIGTDNYFGFDFKNFIESYDGKNTLVAVHDIKDISKACHYGVVLVDGHKATELEEKPFNLNAA